MVFKSTMSTNYSKVTELYIIREMVTKIEHNNQFLTQIGKNLQKLDLSYNLLQKIEHLENVPNLKDLNMSGNKIKKIENLNKMIGLQSLYLDSNQIEKIENLKGLRKLQRISIKNNKVKDILMSDCTDQLLELKELYLQRNQIKTIEAIHSFPNLEEFYLCSNPITCVFPEAFSQFRDLKILYMDQIKLKYPQPDLCFLKKV